MIAVLAPFAPRCSRRVWRHAQRTVTATRRVMGLAQRPQCYRYHRVRSRDPWSSLAAGRVLLRRLVAAFVSDGPLVFGIDETSERRRGSTIAANGICRDAVRSSKGHFVKASGVRWGCLMLLAPIPWAGRAWALPVLTVLAPSQRYADAHGQQHKPITVWARQRLRTVSRRWPQRAILTVADSSDAALAFRAACTAFATPVTVITRLRLDAALYAAPAPHANPDRPADRDARATACPPSPLAPRTRPPPGPRRRSPTGMGRENARWPSSATRRSGITAASPRSRCAGC